jgi:hypothetical protein
MAFRLVFVSETIVAESGKCMVSPSHAPCCVVEVCRHNPYKVLWTEKGRDDASLPQPLFGVKFLRLFRTAFALKLTANARRIGLPE